MMTKNILVLATLLSLIGAGCGKDNGNNSNIAAVPQTCEPNRPVNGYYGWGNQQPCYSAGFNYNICPPGEQRLSTGGGTINSAQSYTCVPSSTLANLGVYPYYPYVGGGAGFSYGGFGNGLICDPYNGSVECGYTGAICYAWGNSRQGVCTFPTSGAARSYYSGFIGF